MGHFVIDDFDFGVDSTRTSLIVKGSTFELKLVGNDAVVSETMMLDEHRWNWLIQPPFLYAISIPCTVDKSGDFEHDITEEELDDFDIALYVMEHCDVFPCKISKKGNSVTVSGKVHGIRATPLEFRGQFEV